MTTPKTSGPPKKKGQIAQINEPNGLAKVQASFLGPDYNYSRRIKSPAQMGMSGSGSFKALGDDIAGLIGYVDLLITGKCNFGTCASTIGKPLGSKFFLKTPVECLDPDGVLQTRSIYVNNVPDGSLPFISNSIDGMGVRFDDFTGLVPGVMSNLSQIHPMQMLAAFTTIAKAPSCQIVKLETIDSNDVSRPGYGFVLNREISGMNSAWFDIPGYRPKTFYKTEQPISSTVDAPKSSEGFTTVQIDHSKMPDDLLIKFYYSSLGLLGIYIFLKMMLKKKLK
jgi:hypothetical protein